MSKNNPYSLVVTVENSTCVVEFDITIGEIDWETIEVFYNKKFKKGAYQKYVAEEWTQVNDLIHDKTWKSIEDQIKAQWDDVEEQQRSYNERY